MQLGCIHSDLPYTEDALVCGTRSIRLTHGWLCIGHYRAQQKAMPPIPRKPRYYQYNDAEVIASILKTEAAEIKAGKIVQVNHAGLLIRFLEAA